MDGQRAPYVEKFIIRKAIQDGRMNITRFEKGTCLPNLHFLGFTLVLGFVPTQKFIFGSPRRKIGQMWVRLLHDLQMPQCLTKPVDNEKKTYMKSWEPKGTPPMPRGNPQEIAGLIKGLLTIGFPTITIAHARLRLQKKTGSLPTSNFEVRTLGFREGLSMCQGGKAQTLGTFPGTTGLGIISNPQFWDHEF